MMEAFCMRDLICFCGFSAAGSDKATSIFGNDLASQVRSDGGSLPLLVKQCVEAVEQRGKTL